MPGAVVAIVSDDPAARTALRLLVRDWGFVSVHGGTLASVADSLAASDRSADVVLLDMLHDSGVDRAEAVAAARQALGRAVPVVLMSGGPCGEGQNVSTEHGLCVLAKPFCPSDLSGVLRALCG